MTERLYNHRPRIMVIGDFMIDRYLYGKTQRISPEAPVPIVAISEEDELPGGAGNVVRNLVSLGAKVIAVTVTGTDSRSQRLTELIEACNVEKCCFIEEKGRKTTCKSRIVSSSQQVVRFDHESTSPISDESAARLLHEIARHIDFVEALLLSDYEKGVLTPDLTVKIVTLAKEKGCKVFVDPKGENFLKYRGVYLMTPNLQEAITATGINIEDDASLRTALLQLKEQCRLDLSIITLSSRGIAWWDREMHLLPAVAKEVYDITGAGDTVVSTLAFALTHSDISVSEAISLANIAAGIVVSRSGAATTTLQEIAGYEKRSSRIAENGIKSLDDVVKIAGQTKLAHKKIVFTNGCFDLLHRGHIRYLEEAKSFGDLLIVGLNSDNSVQRLKGEDRPINSEYDRAYLLAALEAVDYVVIFDEDTPYRLIEAIRPDILVKGGDYAGKEIVGSDIVKDVRLVTFVEGKSSSQIIENIRKGTT